MKQFNFKLFIFCFAVFSLAGIAQLHAKMDTNDECIEDVHVSDADNKSMYNMMASTNLAIAGTATQSSTGSGGVASRAIDGITDGNFTNGSVTHTGTASPSEYWDLDLGQLSSIDEIIFYNRTNCCSDRISEVYVLVADTPFPTDVNDLSGAIGNADFTYQFPVGASSASVTIPVNVSGRYVRLQKSGNNITNVLSIAELEVYGQIDTDGDGTVDRVDLDTDNDGILDVDENVTTSTIEAATWTDGVSATSADGIMDNGSTNLNVQVTVSSGSVGSSGDDLYGASDLGSRNFTIEPLNGVIFNLNFALQSIRDNASIGFFRLSLADGSVITNPSVTISQTSSFYPTDFSTFTGNEGMLLETLINGNKYYTDIGGNPQASGYLLFDASVQNQIDSGGGVVLIEYNQIDDGTPALDGGYGTYLFGTYQAERDTDNDGIPDHLDLDSDNDGVYDAVEAGASPSILDANGRIDVANQGGVSTDGVPNTANSGAGYTLVDTDLDGVFNPYDLDSDGDGCSDANEFYLKADADGRDGDEYGVGTPGVNASTGVVTAAAYDGTTYADALDNTVTRGCQFIQTTTGNWDTTTNWEARTVPILTDDAIIRANSTVTTVQNVNNLTVDPTYTVSINDAQTLNVKANLTNNGDFSGAGYVVFDGNAAQQIIGDGTDAGSFTNIRVNNATGVTLTDDADLFDVLDIDNGNFTVESGDFLTFKSSAGRTAVLGEVNNGTVSGCVVVERYIPAKRAFRYIASPVNTSVTCGKSTIKANIQEGEQVTDFTQYNPATANQNFGTHITGSTNGLNGFDATSTGNPSMFTFSNAGQAWNAIPDTDSSPLNVGTPYAIMIRGGRDMDLNVSNFQIGTETKIRFTGGLATGNQPAPSLSSVASAYNFIANPYQAQVDLGQLLLNDATDIEKTKVWVQDPTNAGQFGAYTLLEFDASGNLASKTPTASNMNGFLQPNQSFFVENTASASSVGMTFKETRKKATDQSLTTSVFSNDTAVVDTKVALDLYEADDNDLRDGVQVRFADNYSDAYDATEDAFKFWNYLESMATSLEDGSYLTLDKRRFEDSGETEIVQLFINNYTATNYSFEIDINNPEGHDIYLVDNYLGTQTLLATEQYSHNFSVDSSVPASTEPKRFQLNFVQTTLGSQDFELSGISIYPNPVKDVVTVNLSQFTGEVNSLSVYDITGKLVSHQDMSNDDTTLEINMENYASGIYVLRIDTNSSQFQHKLIKE